MLKLNLHQLQVKLLVTSATTHRISESRAWQAIALNSKSLHSIDVLNTLIRPQSNGININEINLSEFATHHNQAITYIHTLKWNEI